MHENGIATIILDEAFAVHTHYGPGVFERVYESALEGRLLSRGLSVLRQHTVRITDEYIQDEPGFIIDLLVGGKVIVELKSVEKILPVHKKQVLTYLRLTNRRLGLLINFNEDRLKNGVSRIVNNLNNNDHPEYSI
ncbi:GxxExxY protein [Phaeodactylibacter xiamenensis]|uniref:GxxExxY protein n=1 Tax=Phaeodactylibacter xiamenensis TaxID=1524460 RepID=UPI003BA93025